MGSEYPATHDLVLDEALGPLYPLVKLLARLCLEDDEDDHQARDQPPRFRVVGLVLHLIYQIVGALERVLAHLREEPLEVEAHRSILKASSLTAMHATTSCWSKE